MPLWTDPRTKKALHCCDFTWVVFETTSLATSVVIPLANVDVIGRSKSHAAMLYVALRALFRSLGIVGPVGPNLAMPPSRFRIRSMDRRKLMPRQYGTQ